LVCDWKHFRVMRRNPQPSVVCEWKHLHVMRLNAQPSMVWAEELVSLHVSVSSHKPRKAEDLVSLQRKCYAGVSLYSPGENTM
jgi:hypothetical protein